MVTAKGDEVDRVVGFELGADDYVVKPYSLRELLLRVEAVLRRHDAGARRARRAARWCSASCASIATRTASGSTSEEVTLTALELRLLSTLLERRGRVQSRPALLDDVWGMSGEVTTRTVDTHVKRLREKLGSAGPYIETVRGVGYRFTPAPDHASAVGSGTTTTKSHEARHPRQAVRGSLRPHRAVAAGGRAVPAPGDRGEPARSHPRRSVRAARAGRDATAAAAHRPAIAAAWDALADEHRGRAPTGASRSSTRRAW